MGDEWLRVRRERLAAGWMAAIMTAQEPAVGYTGDLRGHYMIRQGALWET